MNNKSLVNLKFAWEVPGLGTFRIDPSATLRPDILKPLGWHTFSRVMVRKLISVLEETNGYARHAVIADIRHHVTNRHNVPKGWHI